MVGFSDPCPCCGHKRRRSALDRWDSCPPPRSAAEFPPSVKFARSVSAPIAAVVLTDSPPPLPVSPGSVSFDAPISSGVEKNDVAAAPVSNPIPDPNPDPKSDVEEEGGAHQIATEIEKKEVEIEKEGKEEREKIEEEKKKEKKEESWLEIRAPGAKMMRISYKCMCGSNVQLVFSPPNSSFDTLKD